MCDDYESMRVMVTDSLKNLGITKITTASSGNSGFSLILELLKKSPIEFIVTDLVMEDGTGIELAKLVRAHPDTKHLPILMVTSKSEVNLVLESIKAGVNNYVVKPWTPEDLVKRLVEIENKMK